MALEGVKVVEFAGLAPGPFAGLVLADNGASVTRIDRPSALTSSDILCRGKRSLAVNPNISSGRDVLKRLITSADVLIDPFRPGVMERMGLGPDVFLGEQGLNPRLVYARIIGFARTGPHKDMAGHDINYLAISGVLSMLPGSPTKPTFPLNLLADFAGGGLTCALGILLALIQRGATGRGQVVDTDMVSGTRYLASFPLLHASTPTSPHFSGPRGTNLLDGGAPFYDVYACKDGGWMSVGCLEPQFFKVFIERFVASLRSVQSLQSLPQDFTSPDNLRMNLPDKLNLPPGWTPTPSTQSNRAEWPLLRAYMQKGFMMRPRDYWAGVFHGTDACTLPVLSPQEAGAIDPSGSLHPIPHPLIGTPHPPIDTPRPLNGTPRPPIDTPRPLINPHPLNRNGITHPPMLNGTPAPSPSTTPGVAVLLPGQHTEEVLREMGYTDADRERLAVEGAIGSVGRFGAKL